MYGGRWIVLVCEVRFMSSSIDWMACIIIVGGTRVEWLDVSVAGRSHL